MTAANDNMMDYSHAWISTSRRQAAVDWLAIVKEEALKIDPATAEVDWRYALVLDPYGVYPALPEDCQHIGRAYFARRPGSDVWVEFGDLPTKTVDALWEAVWNVDRNGLMIWPGSSRTNLGLALRVTDARMIALPPNVCAALLQFSPFLQGPRAC